MNYFAAGLGAIMKCCWLIFSFEMAALINGEPMLDYGSDYTMDTALHLAKTNSLFKDGVIKYAIEKHRSVETHKLYHVINLISNRSCLNFQEVDEESSNNDPSFMLIKFFNDTSASSFFKYAKPSYEWPSKSAVLYVNLNESKVLLIVRILNAIAGLMFEHQRKDRDNHVKVMWDNIIDEYKGLFKKDKNYPPDEEAYSPYLHGYGYRRNSYLFSKNGKPTVVPLKPHEEMRLGLFNAYMKRVNAIYSKLIYRSYFRGILFAYKGPVECGPKNEKLDFDECPNFVSQYQK